MNIVDVKISDNKSVDVKVVDNKSIVNTKTGCGANDKRLEHLIKELQKNKQNKGFIAIDQFIFAGSNCGIITDVEKLNLLKNYLINKISYRETIYYLISDEDINDSLIYYCYIQEANPNYLVLNKSNGTFTLSKMYLDHCQLSNLDYLNSGHTGFAGIEFGSTEYWNSRLDYVPVEGMLVVYTDYSVSETGKLIPNFKIGNGSDYLRNIEFIGFDMREIIEEHINNTTVHITPEDRARWDNKLNFNEPTSDLLEFNRN